MGRWFKTDFKNSITGLLGGRPKAPSESILENGIEDIRDSMLFALGDDSAKQFPQVTRRIRYANDVHALWYLRGDLMGTLASMHGETIARRKMASISAQFQGLLPGSLASRPSPLES